MAAHNSPLMCWCRRTYYRIALERLKLIALRHIPAQRAASLAAQALLVRVTVHCRSPAHSLVKALHLRLYGITRFLI